MMILKMHTTWAFDLSAYKWNFKPLWLLHIVSKQCIFDALQSSCLASKKTCRHGVSKIWANQPCWIPKPLPPRNQCMGLFAPWGVSNDRYYTQRLFFSVLGILTFPYNQQMGALAMPASTHILSSTSRLDTWLILYMVLWHDNTQRTWRITTKHWTQPAPNEGRGVQVKELIGLIRHPDVSPHDCFILRRWWV